MKKFFKLLLTMSMIGFIFIANAKPVVAFEANDVKNNLQTHSPRIVQVSPETIRSVSARKEKTYSTNSWQNLFDDIVLVSFHNNNGTCEYALLNDGFYFDRCDVTGYIYLYGENNLMVAQHRVNEPKLVYHVARTGKIYPIGGSYKWGEYVLNISDNGTTTTNTGYFSAND